MSGTALLIVDMFNDCRHEDADQLATNVADIVEPLRGLQSAARGHPEVDVIYVNDNHGDFRASGGDIVDAALSGGHPELVRPLLPVDDDSAFLTKVRHSGSTQPRWTICYSAWAQLDWCSRGR